ncbi:MAG: hypothetical protein GY862_19060 [Gammaproteobacteria bacterium]|nr:hypothetical protein [Gammaproteobacteria bacterium]
MKSTPVLPRRMVRPASKLTRDSFMPSFPRTRESTGCAAINGLRLKWIYLPVSVMSLVLSAMFPNAFAAGAEPPDAFGLPAGVLAYLIAGAAFTFVLIAKTVSWEVVTGNMVVRASADRYWRF